MLTVALNLNERKRSLKSEKCLKGDLSDLFLSNLVEVVGRYRIQAVDLKRSAEAHCGIIDAN